ncbi:unnamed protein product [Nippostrongylus brasiliensis]|uniref:Ig-like domain-containing protein n=1 Tax=Nippostrongylus brasiliensis TaxID=27835 RepID=A0A0N4XQQ1_NIPBR|nr:unnamed protein product [Nippostrongylus brasiliensis]
MNGPHAYSPSGELIVARSATVTLSCLTKKTSANSVWEFSSTYRTYPQVWTRMEALGVESADANQVSAVCHLYYRNPH